MSRPKSSPVVLVGSGSAAAACAHALVRRGIRPLVLDAGRSLEPSALGVVRRLAAADPADWTPEQLEPLWESFPVDFDDLPLKPSFGSLYPYATDAPTRAEEVTAVSSAGRGGFSSVWGGAMLPFEARELAAWPVDLEDDYRRVLGFVPLAGRRDALEERFPLFAEPGELPSTPQIDALLADLERGDAALRAAGGLAGRARLALSSALCRQAGICMIGCPYGAIYNAAATIDELARDGSVDYTPGVVVEAAEEGSSDVTLHVRSLGDGTASRVRASRVFVGAGALATTRIALRSLEAFDVSVELLDNAYFTVPLVRNRAARVEPGNAGVTLAQVFLELQSDSRSPTHLQLYGFNDLMLRAVARRLRLPEAVCERVCRPLLGRLLHAQGYLHSSVSPTLRVRLDREGVLTAERGPGPDPATLVRDVIAKLRSLRAVLRARPLTPMLRVWPPGKGFHLGGSFPMRLDPTGLETDVLGRPAGLRRVHLVDASVFPTLPPTTITLSVMANAHRIGRTFDDA